MLLKGDLAMNVLMVLTPKENTHYISAESTVRQALEKFDAHKFTVVPVIDEDGSYISTISEGDLLRFIMNEHDLNLKEAEKINISEVEKYRPYKALDILSSPKEIVELLSQQNFIPIVDGRGMYIGIVKRKEIIDYFYKNFAIKID